MRAENPRFDWNEESVARLLSLTSEGYSASQIASLMGVTRNMVIGKVQRLTRQGKTFGLTQKSDSGRPKNPDYKPGPRKSRAKPKEVGVDIPPRKPGGWNVTQILTRIADKAKPAPVLKPGDFIGPGLPSVKMPTRGKCWYAVNDAARLELHLFCAAPAELSEKGMPHSFCSGHRALTVAPPKVVKNTRSLKEAMAA